MREVKNVFDRPLQYLENMKSSEEIQEKKQEALYTFEVKNDSIIGYYAVSNEGMITFSIQQIKEPIDINNMKQQQQLPPLYEYMG